MTKKKHLLEQLMFIIPTPGRQRQADPWGLLVNQASLLGEFQGSEKPFFKKWIASEGWS